MTVHLAAMLDSAQIRSAQRIAAHIRQGNVAPLVGAGLSVPAGIPLWPELVRRIVQLWQPYDTNSAASILDEAQYFDLLQTIFNRDNLAITSFIRRMLPESGTGSTERPQFRELVERALYAEGSSISSFPQHTQIHNHLVALFAPYPNRLWTTNFDDLLEVAAKDAGHDVRALHAGFRTERNQLSVAHLHGFIPPHSRASMYPQVTGSPLVLAEDDFHVTAGDPTGWTTREFISLLDRFNVLILGMSLDDPHLRRVLTINTVRDAATGDQRKRHFAIIKSPQVTDAHQNWYREYWAAQGVELMELPSHDHLLPFLARLRYETYGNQPGRLWQAAAGRAAEYGRQSRKSRTMMYYELNKAIDLLTEEFHIPREEIAEMGIFLIHENAETLVLAFRSSQKPDDVPSGRRFSINPDAPTGNAGRVFVSSEVVRIDRSHESFDFGLEDSERNHHSNYEGLISVPIIDWQQGGLPLGIVYVSTTTNEGVLFSEPVEGAPTYSGPTLERVQRFLHSWALEMLEICREG